MELITGATGLLGSHLAERIVAQGRTPRALVRPTSATAFLRGLGVDLAVGNLSDPASLRRALDGVKIVYHAAAKVGDWGTAAEFQRDTLQGTRNLIDACRAAGIERFVHVSSTSAYGHPPPTKEPIDETYPLGDRYWWWDDYTRAKVAVERDLWSAWERDRLPMTIIRPSWLYGERDRLSIFRIADTLRRGRVRIIGPGTNPLNSVYAGNVADACLVAARHPAALGQAFNVTNDGAAITQLEYFNTYADILGFPRPTRHIRYRLAFAAAAALESAYRLVRARRPPFITRYSVWLLGRPTFYSTAKAQKLLGWQPAVTFAQGVQRTVAWYRGQVS